jgi:hypothetical protein
MQPLIRTELHLPSAICKIYYVPVNVCNVLHVLRNSRKMKYPLLLKTCNLKTKTPKRPMDCIILVVAFESIKPCHVYQMFWVLRNALKSALQLHVLYNWIVANSAFTAKFSWRHVSSTTFPEDGWNFKQSNVISLYDHSVYDRLVHFVLWTVDYYQFGLSDLLYHHYGSCAS